MSPEIHVFDVVAYLVAGRGLSTDPFHDVAGTFRCSAIMHLLFHAALHLRVVLTADIALAITRLSSQFGGIELVEYAI